MVNKADLPLAIAAGQIEEPRTDVLVPEVEGYTTTSTEVKLNRTIQDEVWQLMLTQGYGQEETHLTGRFALKNNQARVLSLTLTMYQFSGGAHGTTLEHGLTFDSDTGHLYTLPELFKPKK
ncbi:probable anti-SigV factor [Geomicrobium sp. JCM 19037]|uniref:PdaC/SigV domain-containing protein n=1 Tax=Geomicrobium sp. JCM 19037 TaxID=1460634 RepID=UPI00045F2CCA|nr:DUF4163 domain-containing protein [Geomicrobium sp. JCM 19037]GAK05729.1 probable anti-SigV factor [Geomicrobium sp. JCM 19037]